MTPFDFIITLLSFVYSLALAHVLAGVARLVRYRQSVIWSAPHAAWLVTIALFIVVNWLALWDFRRLPEISLGVIALGVLYAVLLYLIAAFVTPDADQPDDRDLVAYHARERRTYVGTTLLLVLVSLVSNWAAGAIGIANWAEQNVLVVLAVPILLVALIARPVWLQTVAALAMTVNVLAFAILYYPVLR